VNLERFTSLDLVRKEPQLWQTVAELLEQSEMPPKDKPQPKAEERKRIATWVRKAVETETHAPAETLPGVRCATPAGGCIPFGVKTHVPSSYVKSALNRSWA